MTTSGIPGIVSAEEGFSVLQQFNPWWSGRPIPDLPYWSRAAFADIYSWLSKPAANRALLVTGARQIGKTTLLLQCAAKLVQEGVPPEQILYITLDHPLIKLLGLDKTLHLWRELQPSKSDIEYLLLDEIQYAKDWQVWIKHQVDFNKRRRIVFTGSATPLVRDHPESGAGRWNTIHLPTLSFDEYLHIKGVKVPDLPDLESLGALFDWGRPQLLKVMDQARELTAHFHDYILRGGFPQTILVESIHTAQKLLREDVVDRVLKRDMTALYGVRNVLELERTFLYLCLHDGGILDMTTLASNLQVGKATASSFIDQLEAAHLIYRLRPYGYGKEVLRGRSKVYLADSAIAGSMLLMEQRLLEDTTRLGQAVEAAVFKHLLIRYAQFSTGYSYWQDKRRLEVDVVAQLQGQAVPFEIKYTNSSAGAGDLKGLLQFSREHATKEAYLITRNTVDFGVLEIEAPVRIMRIPAPLACYWLSKSEVEAPP